MSDAASEVRQLRARHRLREGDVYGLTGLTEIVDRGREEAHIEPECAQIRGLFARLPEFPAACGYDWCSIAASYDVATDAAYQRRALFMLAKYWIETPDRVAVAPLLKGLVVVQQFITRFGLSSPRIKSSDGNRLLFVPAGFVEFAAWLYAGLRCWAAAESAGPLQEGDGWDLVTAPLPSRDPKPFPHVTALEIIARTLSEQGRDLRLHGANATLLIRERIPALAGETGELDPDALKDFEQNATYILVEFAIAHELGHVLSGHDLQGGSTYDGQQEREADLKACLLLEMTSTLRLFGWGEPILAPATQAALALALFDCHLTARTALVGALTGRQADAGAGATKLNGEEMSRKRSARRLLAAKLVELSLQDLEGDALRVAALVANCDRYVRDLVATTSTLTDADVALALSVARETVDP